MASNIRLDQVTFSTLHETPKNYDTLTGDIAVSGTVADGATSLFTATFPYSRAGTRADVYLDGNDKRVSASSGARAAGAVYSYSSTEDFSAFVSYSTTDITVTLSIFNGTGSPVTLNSQTITAIVVLIDAPITPL